MTKTSSKILLLPLTAFYIYLLYKHLTIFEYASILDFLNLGIHELGHVVFSPFGMFIAIAGGTILQLSAPLVGMYMFKKQKDKVAMLFGVVWLATNFLDVAIYVSDAKEMALPLLSLGGGEAIHDWNYMLNKTNLIFYDDVIGGTFWLIGLVLLLLAIIGNFYLIYKLVKKEI